MSLNEEIFCSYLQKRKMLLLQKRVEILKGYLSNLWGEGHRENSTTTRLEATFTILVPLNYLLFMAPKTSVSWALTQGRPWSHGVYNQVVYKQLSFVLVHIFGSFRSSKTTIIHTSCTQTWKSSWISFHVRWYNDIHMYTERRTHI